MTNKEIGKRIKDTRISKGKTLEDIATEIGVARSTVQRYETGKIDKIKLPVISAIADALGVNDAWLIGKSEKMLINDVERFWNYAKDFNRRNFPEQEERVRIPILGRVAAGIPITAIEEIIDWEDLPTYAKSGDTYFGLLIKSDSMEPGMQNGDTIIVRQQDTAEDGQIVVCIINGSDGCCKRLKRYENGTIALMSDNPSYQPMYFNTAEIDSIPVRICGVVVELRRKF